MLIESGKVYDVFNTGLSEVKQFYCMEKKVVLTTDKKIITSDGIDKAVITAKLFDWKNNEVRVAIALKFILNGEVIDKQSSAQGIATIEFTSFERGLYILRCEATEYDPGEVGVEVV